MTATTPGALTGIRIVDFSRVLAGPYATMLLSDFGAAVTRLERPNVGDDTRGWGPPWHEGESTYFLALNRNKTSIGFDLTSEADRAMAHEMIAEADVVVENFRPGTMERYGFGYEQLAAENPGLVYCSVSGFGSDGGAHLPGYDLIAQATGGLMSITGHPETGPAKVGVAMVDAITGLHAAMGIQTALIHRLRTGEGQRVEVNLLSSVLASLTNQVSGHIITGNVPGLMGNAHPSVAPYQPLNTADRPLAVAAANDRQFAALCRSLGLPELIDDPRFDTNANRVINCTELVESLETVLRTDTADHWFAVLGDADVPAGPINDIGQAIEFADSLGLSPVVEPSDEPAGTGVAQIRNPIRLSKTPPTYRTNPPKLPTR
ncbi:CoA transferase [Gordonia sp. HY285]|uniref:CoA transferase n=1 Tax=Gordonia liuliyuniae TaxID=2911517 RepID=A0ABS9ITQ2_9ACTN|nr:CoA transferase [Gordonia liuliyuniae]MCF8588936.1 CoA transferase [Gordonia liuliyuniae]MCF8609183.1 CoA transferase [Gordonia liuliyuniae]